MPLFLPRQISISGSSPGQILIVGLSGSATWSNDLAMGAFGSTPSANAGIISSKILYLQPADLTHPGGISLTDQVIGSGTKTFSSIISPKAYNTNGASASDVCFKVGTSEADGSVNASSKIFTVRTGVGSTEVEQINVLKGGIINQQGTDSSATPGNATINKATGISAISINNTTVTITNSLVTATSKILITWLGDHGAARSWVVRSAGSFTVTLSSAASVNTSFAWEISYLI
jgi:hypothetical protein